MRFAILCAVLLLMSFIVYADFQLKNLSVTIDMRPDGTASVKEVVRISMDSGSPIIYDTAMSTANDLSSWRTKTNLDLRFHFNRDIVDISDVSIRAQPRDNCIACVRDVCEICYGTVIINYNLGPIKNKTESGLFLMNHFKPRTTNYSLNPASLSFESSTPGNIVLQEDTKLVINVPPGSVITSLNPLPEGMEGSVDFPIYNTQSFSWKGRTTLSNFEFSFQIEEPLSVEVLNFFMSVRDDGLNVLYSREGLAIIMMGIVVLVSLVLLRRYTEK